MTNTELFRKTVRRSGLKYKSIADFLGITPFCLAKKIDNITEFKASEIEKISSLLKLTDKRRNQIFFYPNSELKSTNETEAIP